MKVDLNKENNIKYIPISEDILCKDGWKNINSVLVGEEVYGIDGCLHKVKELLVDNQDVYEFTFSNGKKVKVGEDSILRVSTKKQEENMKKFNDERFMYLSLIDILSSYKKENIFYDRVITEHKYSCQTIKPIQYDKINLFLDPYLLGLLLGDGGFTTNIVTFTNPEDDILKEFNDLISNINMEVHYRDFENHKQGTVCAKNGDTVNKLNKILNKLELKGLDSRQKFIPDAYKISSVEDRLSLLSGIINTDGHIDDKGIINICTYSTNLYNDIKNIADSLGLMISTSEYNRTSEDSTKKYNEEIEYRIRVLEPNYDMFKLSKKHLSKLKNRKKFVNKIVNIEKCNSDICLGLLIDNDQRVITKDYIAI